MDKKFINWRVIMQSLLGKSTSVEDEQVDKWLHEDTRNQDYYQKAKYYFDNYYSVEEEIHQVDTKKAWNDFLVYTKRSRNSKWRRYLQYAAGVVMLVGVGVALLLLVGKSEKSVMIVQNQVITPGKVKALLVFQSGSQVSLTDSTAFEQVVGQYTMEDTDEETKMEYNTIIVPRGGEYSLALADGTRIKMNSDSKLIFPHKFSGKERRVRLEGEALFDVEKDSEHPFIVETAKGDVHVLGTLFNINVYPDEDVAQTTLVEGRVVFKGKGMLQNVELFPREQVTYNMKSGESHVEEVNTKVYVGWAEGKWLIEGKRLEDIMKQLSRWYDVEVFYKNPEAKELVFTGDLEKYDDCEVVLNIISMTTNVTFTIRDRAIIVQMK